MLQFYHGKASFLIQKEIEKAKRRFIREYPQASIDLYDIEDSYDLGKIYESFELGGGLFSPKKLVIIKNILFLPAHEQKKFSELLSQYSSDENIIGIFTHPEAKEKKNVLLALLFKDAKIKEYKPLEGQALRKWIMDEMASRSNSFVKIESMALERLIAITKGDLWQMDTELEKLICYQLAGAAEQPPTGITIEEIDMLCQGELEAKIFDLIDAVARKHTARAHQLLQTIFAQGENGFYIFSMIVYQFRNLLRIADMRKKGHFDASVLSRKLGLHPYVVQKSLQQLPGFSVAHLKEMYSLAMTIDVQVKTGEREMVEALTYLIAKTA